MAVTASAVQSAALVALTIIATVALTLWLVSAGVIPIGNPASASPTARDLYVACFEGGGTSLHGFTCVHPAR